MVICIIVPWHSFPGSPICSWNITPRRYLLRCDIPVAFKFVCCIFFKWNNRAQNVELFRYFWETSHYFDLCQSAMMVYWWFLCPSLSVSLAFRTTRFSRFPSFSRATAIFSESFLHWLKRNLRLLFRQFPLGKRCLRFCGECKFSFKVLRWQGFSNFRRKLFKKNCSSFGTTPVCFAKNDVCGAYIKRTGRKPL